MIGREGEKEGKREGVQGSEESRCSQVAGRQVVGRRWSPLVAVGRSWSQLVAVGRGWCHGK